MLGFGAPDKSETAQLLKLHQEALRYERRRLRGVKGWLARTLAEHEIRDIEETIERLQIRKKEL